MPRSNLEAYHKKKNKQTLYRSGQGSDQQLSHRQDGRGKWATGAITIIKLPTQGTSLGTWKFRTLYAYGRIQELTYELWRCCWNIIGLSDVRPGISETSTENGHKIWFYREEKNISIRWHPLSGKRLQEVSSAISCTPISGHISIRVTAKLHMAIIQFHASNHDDEKVDKFYEFIESTIAEVPKKNITIVQRHWNSKELSRNR